MLRQRDDWENLSNEEKLVLLAVAHEIPNVNGFQVKDLDVMEISGLRPGSFWPVIWHLQHKGLLEVEEPDNMSCKLLNLAGEATVLNRKMIPPDAILRRVFP